MINIESLHVGDLVKIVDAWVPDCYQNNEGYMDKYLGKVVTVRSVGDDYIHIEEDIDDTNPIAHSNQGWYWYAAALEPYEPEEIVQVSEADFLSSLSILGL